VRLTLAVPYAMLWIVLMRALLVRARLLVPTCPRCGRRRERSRLGEPICACKPSS
jgi:hypothetical protein